MTGGGFWIAYIGGVLSTVVAYMILMGFTEFKHRAHIHRFEREQTRHPTPKALKPHPDPILRRSRSDRTT